MAKTDDFLRAGDGHITITLATPATVAGAKVTSLRMREPLVSDQIASSKAGGDSSDSEISLMANLLEISPDDVRGMTLRNYTRLQKALLSFID